MTIPDPLNTLTKTIESIIPTLIIARSRANDPQEREDIEALLIQLYETQLTLATMTHTAADLVGKIEQEGELPHDLS